MRRPDLTNTTAQDTQVNVSSRWENLEKEIIATGLCDGKLFNILHKHYYAYLF